LPGCKRPLDVTAAAAGLRLGEILLYGRKNFDIVLVDTPPVLQNPDAPLQVFEDGTPWWERF
jgi:Mrp family chromosome partitioning ATPase